MDSDIYLLYGNISKSDIIRARDIIGTEDVYEVKMKENDPNLTDQLGVIVYVKYLFIDLPLERTLKELLSMESHKLLEVVDYFKLTGKTNNFISINLMLTYDRKIFTLLIVTDVRRYELTLSLAQERLMQFAEEAHQDDCIKIMLNEKDELDITSCKHLKDLYSIVKESI